MPQVHDERHSASHDGGQQTDQRMSIASHDRREQLVLHQFGAHVREGDAELGQQRQTQNQVINRRDLRVKFGKLV